MHRKPGTCAFSCSDAILPLTEFLFKEYKRFQALLVIFKDEILRRCDTFIFGCVDTTAKLHQLPQSEVVDLIIFP